MTFEGAGRPLTRSGLSGVLERLGLVASDAACIWAVVHVETSDITQGFGFRPDRRPQILFERHKFRQFTRRRFDREAPGISGPAGGYGTVAAQYRRLEQALDCCARAGLDDAPALEATSWGMGQIMGFNHEPAGFGSARAMVEAFKDGEDDQLTGMAGFLVHNRLDRALARREWARFAAGYNGRDYAKNRYDVKLAEQYERFASGSLPSLEVRTAQAALLFLNYSPGRIDGVLGGRTKGALGNFRIANGLPPHDALDGATYDALCQKAGIGS